MQNTSQINLSMTNLQDTFSQISCNEFILRTLDIWL